MKKLVNKIYDFIQDEETTLLQKGGKILCWLFLIVLLITGIIYQIQKLFM